MAFRPRSEGVGSSTSGRAAERDVQASANQIRQRGTYLTDTKRLLRVVDAKSWAGTVVLEDCGAKPEYGPNGDSYPWECWSVKSVLAAGMKVVRPDPD